MNCQQARNQLGRYLDNELAPDVREAVTVHLGACDACTAELESVRAIAAELARPDVTVPDELWNAIESRLDAERVSPGSPRNLRLLRVNSRVLGMAAMVALAAGLGLFLLLWSDGGVARVEAASIRFDVLLDALPLDAKKAFNKFLVLYDARKTTPIEARQYAPGLTFDLPDMLPGGFHLEEVYTLRIEGNPGIAATYARNGEFLGTIFHAPVLPEDYGTHRDYDCVIGKHRGHKVEVGQWKLVHFTDPTTCHCILSKLNEETELPAIVVAVAPGLQADDDEHHRHSHRH